MLTIEIETGDEAFADGNEAAELARILREAARRIEVGHKGFYLYDENGNLVGPCAFRPGREEE